MYTVDGGRHLPERELEHLAGYEGSRPVRVGNAAVDQRQTDVLGEVMCALRWPATTGWPRRGQLGLQRTLVASSPSTGSGPTTASGRSAGSRGTSPTAG